MEEKYCLTFGEAITFRDNFLRRALDDTKSGKLVWRADIDKKQYSTTLVSVDGLGVNARLVVSRTAVDSFGDFTEIYKLIIAKDREKALEVTYSIDYDEATSLIDYDGDDRQSVRGECIVHELWTIVTNGARS